jgi:hypothetical protein
MKTITQYHARRAAARAIRLSALLLSSAVLLAACGGDGGDAPPKNANESDRQSLLYAYPDNGQTEVATPSPIVLRFTSAVAAVDAEAAITLHQGDENGPALPFTAEPVADEPRGIVLTPENDLAPLADYTVTIRDLRLAKGTAADQDLHFTTRALQRGPRSLVIADEAFKVSRTLPNDTAAEPVMDFSTFRFQFTQPIDATTARYGQGTADTVNLVDSIGNLVDAIVLVDGPYLTVDPKPEYLTAGETYTLTLRGGLTSTYGATFASTMISFTPRDSSPRGEPAVLVQRITDSENRTNTSLLTGEPVNEVPVNATLLGENSATQTSGDVLAELADVTIYPDVTPVRIPRDTILTGSNIDVMIGGEVPAGISSGEVKMHFLSDATGYLVPNPYNNVRDDALRIVHLFMDVGIATEDPRANGGFTQDILHIELVGVADVDTTEGTLNIDAVSVVEPDILGQEFGYGVLSFQLQSYPQQDDLPAQALAALEQEDTTPPELQSWVPGENAKLQGPDDPIILTFSEVISKDLFDGSSVKLYENGSEVPVSYHIDGASLVINPQNPLKYDGELSSFSYEVQVDASTIKDLAGNSAVGFTLTQFNLPEKVEQRQPTFFGSPVGPFGPTESRAPLVLAMNPGFPCALDPSTRNLAQNDAGRCLGGFPGWEQGTSYDIKPEDDHIPVTEVPPSQPIIVLFSKPIDPNSVELGSSFVVQEIDHTGEFVSDVAGSLDVDSKSITFMPARPWSEQVIYKYILASSSAPNPSCDGSGAICDLSGLPLQTQILGPITIEPVDPPEPTALFPPEREWKFLKENISPEAGGPDLVQYFRGGKETESVMQVLRAAPVSDVNANFIHEANEAVSDGVMSIPILQPYSYSSEEVGAAGQPFDPFSDPSLDPGGVQPPPNSAKVLSKDTKGLPPGENPVLNGINVGCGYASTEPYDLSDPSAVYGIPLSCPEQKFTYLNGALTAEVTSTFESGKGLKVKIWPGQIMSTALYVRQHTVTGGSFLFASSGAQLLRMRYEENEIGKRVNPITGWIKDSINGPILEAEVDVYMDGLELSQVGLQFNDPTHSLNSYPIKMELSGSVRFLEDGRMVVEQYNVNPIDVDVRVQVPDGSWAGSMQLMIPAYGSRLQYISNPVK